MSFTCGFFFSRKRVPRERGAGGSGGDRTGNTGLGDRNPGGPRRVPGYLPIRVDPRGPLLFGDRTDVGRNRLRKLRTSVSARWEVCVRMEREREIRVKWVFPQFNASTATWHHGRVSFSRLFYPGDPFVALWYLSVIYITLEIEKFFERTT